MADSPNANRRANGTFGPGNKASPGRPVGSMNKRSKKMLTVLGRYSERIALKIVELALRGDSTALKIYADKILPSAQGAKPATFIKIDLPPISSVADVPIAMATVSAALAAGTLSTDAAAAIVGIFKSYAEIVHASDIDERLRALEAAVEARRNMRQAA